MAIFKNKLIRRQEYGLTHLEPFAFDLLVGSSTLRIGVEFTCHCFTETLTQAHAPDFRYFHGGETRAFSVERHSLSLLLPSLVTTLGNRSVYHSEQGNFFFLRDINAPHGTSPYLVFFDMFRATSAKENVRMLVRSAYLKPNMSRFAAPVRFTNLVSAIAKGEKLPLGPRQQIKRR
jgi:hypothetical protein